MSIGNPRIELAVRNADCTGCKMSQEAQGKDRCRTAQGSHNADVLIISKSPLGERGKTELLTYLERAGFDPARLAFTGATKCLVWQITANKTEIKACREYLHAEIAFIKPKWILCLGNEALFSATGRSGIMKYRGHTFPITVPGHTTSAMATIAPAMVHRNPGQKDGFQADLEYFYNRTQDNDVKKAEPTPDEFTVVDTKESLRSCVEFLKDSHTASFDLETSGFDEFAPDARIISMAITAIRGDVKHVFAIPLWHRESPWRSAWRKVFLIITQVLEKIKRRIAHNGKFDCRWMRHFGSKITITFDSMLASHLLNENRPKGLKPLSRQILGAPPWDISISNQKDRAWYDIHKLKDILWYNALDTWHALGLSEYFKRELIKQPRLARIFKFLVIPASNEFIDVERKGVWVDQEQMATNRAIAEMELVNVEEELMKWVPENHPHVVKFRDGSIKHSGVNFNPSNFCKWWLFDYLKLPILGRGKQKENGDPGDPSMAEAIMLELKSLHQVPDLLLKRVGWVKNIQFFKAYSEQADSDDRVHTTFKLTGTVTGRLSSGKADADKITGVRANSIRGVNLQQVPRIEFVRGVFGAPNMFSFIEADYSQVELRVAAMIANEPTMLHLYATGQDIHMAMAMKLTGKPASQITKEERKMSKAVNFGFLYGMGWMRFIQTAWSNYELRVSEAEARAFRKAFFDQFPKLREWHSRQRRLAHKYGRVATPMGRLRHLPDITSSDDKVRAEAERQAINSPVQGFASDMALMAMVMLGKEFRERRLKTTPIGTVHDAVNFEAPNEELAIVLPIIKDTMENLPLKRLFGVDVTVPIVADLKVGKRWGGARELSVEEVYGWSA